MSKLVPGTVLGYDVVGVVPGSGEVGVAESPQDVASSTTAISSARMSASRSFGKALYSVSTTYPLHRASACGLPAAFTSEPGSSTIPILSHFIYPHNACEGQDVRVFEILPSVRKAGISIPSLAVEQEQGKSEFEKIHPEMESDGCFQIVVKANNRDRQAEQTPNDERTHQR